MKLSLENIKPDEGSSFRILLTPNLNEVYYWHFHPEIELVYVEAEKGIRHIGDHISTYEGSDLALIGSYIPHLNFDYGVKTTVETVVVQCRQYFYEDSFYKQPEMQLIYDLMERAKTGIAFFGDTKNKAGDLLKKLNGLSSFEQLIILIQVFQILAISKEYTLLNTRPIEAHAVIKEQERMHVIYKYVEAHFQEPIKIFDIASKVNLTEAAFCRYFKKATKLTYTDFVNQYRVNHAKKLLMQNTNVTEACYDTGFESLSYFNKIFKKITGENPSSFRKRKGLN
jgi:YesN/AraC family two-component response regulator